MRAAAVLGALAVLVSIGAGDADGGAKQAQLLKYAEQRAENAENELARVKKSNEQVVSVCEAATERHETALTQEREKMRGLADKVNTATSEAAEMRKKLFDFEKSMQEKIEARVAEAKSTFEEAMKRATAGAKAVMSDNGISSTSDAYRLITEPFSLIKRLGRRVIDCPTFQTGMEYATTLYHTTVATGHQVVGQVTAFAADKLSEDAVKSIVVMREKVAAAMVPVWETKARWCDQSTEGRVQAMEKVAEIYTMVAARTSEVTTMVNEKLDEAAVWMDLDPSFSRSFLDRAFVILVALLVLRFALKFTVCLMGTLMRRGRCCKGKEALGKQGSKGSDKGGHQHTCDKHKGKDAKKNSNSPQQKK